MASKKRIKLTCSAFIEAMSFFGEVPFLAPLGPLVGLGLLTLLYRREWKSLTSGSAHVSITRRDGRIRRARRDGLEVKLDPTGAAISISGLDDGTVHIDESLCSAADWHRLVEELAPHG